MTITYEVGDAAKIKKFAFTNKSGGTGLSNWEHDPRFTGVAEARVTKTWYDYETGQRYVGTPVSQNLKDYLKANAKNQVLFFGEFDLVV